MTCFGSIRNYIILKLPEPVSNNINGFGSIRNYIILKRYSRQAAGSQVLDLYEITSSSNKKLDTPRQSRFWIYTKLHHPQTIEKSLKIGSLVLDLYEITSSSNAVFISGAFARVLDLYEITSSSNGLRTPDIGPEVLDLYEITSSSNQSSCSSVLVRFGSIRNYIILKPSSSDNGI